MNIIQALSPSFRSLYNRSAPYLTSRNLAKAAVAVSAVWALYSLYRLNQENVEPYPIPLPIPAEPPQPKPLDSSPLSVKNDEPSPSGRQESLALVSILPSSNTQIARATPIPLRLRRNLRGEEALNASVLLQKGDFSRIRLATPLPNIMNLERQMGAYPQPHLLTHFQRKETSLPPSGKAISDMLQKGGVSKSAFQLALKQFYGETLISRTERSGLIGKFPETLTKQHMFEWLGLICQGVTLDDLSFYLTQIGNQPLQPEIVHLIHLPRSLFHIQKAEQLPEEIFRQYFTIFRNPLQFLIGPKASLWEELRAFKNPTNSRCNRYVFHDYEIHQLMKADRAAPEFPLVPHEMLSRVVAYAKPESIELGAIIPVFNEEIPGIAYYQLASRFNQAGIHAYLFTPIHHPDLPAKLIFRGTGGQESLQRDMESSVGKETFHQFSEELLNMIPILQPSKIDICGHSLGAADAQRMAALIVDKIANEELPVERVRMFAYCSPKIDLETVNEWKKNIDRLSERENPPQIELWYAEHAHDLVTWAGESNLPGSHHHPFIHSNHLLVESTSKIWGTSQHHRVPFFTSGVFDFATAGRRFTLFMGESYKKALAEMGDTEAVENGEYRLVGADDLSFQAAQRVLGQSAELLPRIEAQRWGAAQQSGLLSGISRLVSPFKEALRQSLSRR